MTTDERLDPILRLLADLPPATPMATRDARVRSRCHLVLARRQRVRARRSGLASPGIFDATLIAAAGSYAAAAAFEALRLVRFL